MGWAYVETNTDSSAFTWATSTASNTIYVPIRDEYPAATDPWDGEEWDRAKRHARNKAEQSLDCEQFRRPPRRCGRGEAPLRKWEARRGRPGRRGPARGRSR